MEQSMGAFWREASSLKQASKAKEEKCEVSHSEKPENKKKGKKKISKKIGNIANTIKEYAKNDLKVRYKKK